MSVYILYLLVIGLLLLFMTLGSTWIERLPFSFALIYLIVGFCLGPYVLGLIKLRPSAEFLERACEFVVLVSVFACGMKMNRPLKLWAWTTTARLIGFVMPLTIIAIAAACHWLLGWNWPEAVLLGAILAPTDPVLASEVQLAHVEDKDELRFGLTSEGGLNDALAFPFVYFGIYWLEKGSLDKWFKEWVAIDLIWAIGAAIAMGVIVAGAIVWLENKLRSRRSIDSVVEDFIALSTILLTYSLTEIVNGYGFLSVFVAGYTVQSLYYNNQERRHAQLEFLEQIEKLLEIGALLLIGTLLLIEPLLKYSMPALIVAGLVLFIIRPASTWLGFLGSRIPKPTLSLLGWFGVRGVGSIYYLSYALGKGIEGEIAEQIAWITLSVIIFSVIIHGISATPFMDWYEHQMEGLRKKEV